MGQQMRLVCHMKLIGMHEISVLAGLDPVQHRMGMIYHQIIPPHMRHFQ